jgi:hypothetical protein
MTKVEQKTFTFLSVKNKLTYITYTEPEECLEVSSFNDELNAYDHSHRVSIYEIDLYLEKLWSEMEAIKKMKEELLARGIINVENN